MPRLYASIAVAVALALLLAANHSGKLIDIVWAKGMRRDQPWMEFARWNAISRVEVNLQGTARYIVIDADASTAIMNVDPARWAVDTPTPAPTGNGLPRELTYNWKRDLMAAPPALANVLRPRGDYAIIGPGGGVDVLRALANGSPNVTAIEINPIIATTIMRERYADYAHHLYELPQVHLHVSDGRSWIRASREQYDVIEMTLVDTFASTAAGAFALSENNLYTVEAFREYFEHLKPDGIIAITRWEFREPREALRVVSQELAAMPGQQSDYAPNFLIIAESPLDEDGKTVCVLVKKTPFTDGEIDAVLRHVAADTKLHMIFAAGRTDAQVVAAGARIAAADAVHPFQDLILSAGVPGVYRQYGSSMSYFIAQYPYNITPVTDDAPFFFFTMKTGQVLRNIARRGPQGIDWYPNLGVVVLGMVLLISVVAVLAFLILPLLLIRRHPERSVREGGRAVEGPLPYADIAGEVGVLRRSAPQDDANRAASRHPGLAMAYFIALGLGYILVEIALIQRFVLFLGHPTYALTVVVFLLLLSSGAGSMAARRWLRHVARVRIVLGDGYAVPHRPARPRRAPP